MPLLKDASFTINMFNDAGHSDPDPRLNHVRVLPDRPPTVQLIKPSKISTVAPGDSVPVMIRATDDYAVGRVRLEMEVRKTADGQRRRPVGRRGRGAGGAAVGAGPRMDHLRRHHQRHAGPSPGARRQEIPSGHTVRIRASAWDKRDVSDWGLDLKPQQADSDWTVIRVIAEEAKVTQTIEQLDNLRGSLWKIMEKQLLARVKTAQILQKKELGERAAIAGDVRADQVDIQKQSVALVATVKNTDKEERLVIKRALSALAAGDMVEAVRQCDELVKISAVDDFTKPVPLLTAVQDRIIDRLRKMLDVTRKAQTDVLAEASKRPVGNLPPDVKEKLEEAEKKLEEFLKQQKKVIDATTDAAKTPVEDFTRQGRGIAEEAGRQEDDLARFLKDLHSDLSKLPDQDFANGTLATELNEVQTELKMAEDALLKKSTDIAVPLEQLGYEKAKEQVSNLEKWLPDKPDREKWSQEEALSATPTRKRPWPSCPASWKTSSASWPSRKKTSWARPRTSPAAPSTARQGRRLGRQRRPHLRQQRQGRHRQPSCRARMRWRASRRRPHGQVQRRVRGRRGGGQGRPQDPQPLDARSVHEGPDQGPQQGRRGRRHRRRQGERRRAAKAWKARPPEDPGHRDMGRLAGKQAALNNKAQGDRSADSRSAATITRTCRSWRTSCRRWSAISRPAAIRTCCGRRRSSPRRATT